ncbi:hypothetical protein DPMN_065104 [Dreissena polymorpha]|uniref:Uncharacterized protein n=1 Tax=Dreissena polymorpha TaxID=45954 RepID=A0A9D4HMT1_DREPO|nr:hypothetical protein DPMN_065104 [Dreissena polymorpha]
MAMMPWADERAYLVSTTVVEQIASQRPMRYCIYESKNPNAPKAYVRRKRTLRGPGRILNMESRKPGTRENARIETTFESIQVRLDITDLVHAEHFPNEVYKCMMEEKYGIVGGCCNICQLSTNPKSNGVRQRVKIILIFSLVNSELVPPIFLVKGPLIAAQLAKGPVVTTPSPFPRKAGENKIESAGFAMSKSSVESQ